jgi:metal-responsive CopG/Arc/MetJ family transcriptional regulator
MCILTNMKPIQVMMDERLLKAVDSEAKRLRSDRSKLIRLALARYLTEARRRSLEEQDRQGYVKRPQRRDETDPWLEIQAWPED